MVEIAQCCPYYEDRSVASGHAVMTRIMLVCLFKISLECIHADPRHHSGPSWIQTPGIKERSVCLGTDGAISSAR